MDKLIVITGTTASGKSDITVEIAKKYGGEIVSADSRQVFKGLDLGTGKITKEEMQGVPHYLLDVAEPGEYFSLADFQRMAYEAIDNINSRNKQAFLCGGTGLYINAVVDGYCLQEARPDPKLRKKVEETPIEELITLLKEKDPDALTRVDLKNKRRVERAAEKVLLGRVGELPKVKRYDSLVIGVTWPRDILYERIGLRLDKRLEMGMIDEVKALRDNGVSDEFLYKLGLEYRYILMYLRGEFSDFDSFKDKLFMEIRHLAKEQMTWFRKRDDIQWIDMDKDPVKQASEMIERFTDR